MLSCAGSVLAQTEREKGIEFYKQGKIKAAIEALEKASEAAKTDAEVWNFLGLAYLKSNNLKQAVKAFGKAVESDAGKVSYQSNLAYAYLLGGNTDKAQSEAAKAIALDAEKPDAYYIRGAASFSEGKYDEAIKDADQAVKINSDYARAYTLKSDALFSKFGKGIRDSSKRMENLNYLTQSKQVLDECLKNCRDNSETSLQKSRLEAVETFYDYYSKKKDGDLTALSNLPILPNPNIKPLKFISKPFPSYTDAARQAQVNGTITVLVLFAGNGQVSHTIVLQSLGYGLDENAVRAAKAIKFEPAEENGKPISQIKLIQYSFRVG